MFEHQELSITIAGHLYRKKDFDSDILFDFAVKSPFHSQLYYFLKDWYSDSLTLTVKTSGSTGTPKEMQVSKLRMMQSAKLTSTFLQLEKDDKAMLCMSLDYIAGKMMVVRALVAGLDLYAVEPNGNPLKDIENLSFDFSAMIPLQVYNTLNNNVERKSFEKIKHIIIGGGAIDEKLEEQLKPLSNNIYSSYGMTETLSHIALRKLNGKDASKYYIPFPSVKLSLSEDNALIIDAPLVADERLYTNDIACINADGSFYIVGRKDNIINTGGVKVQIEEVESLLKPLLNIPFAITSLSDAKFGEVILLVIESSINEELLNELPKYYRPKRVFIIDKIPLTGTGKISRKELKNLIETNYKNI